MNSTKKQARVAAILYLLACSTAPFSLIYLPRTLIVPGDATATANHVRASETLLRMGIASELFISIVLIFAVLAFYRLLKRVSEKHALAMLILLLVSIPISLLNVLNEIAALILVSGTGFLSTNFQPHLFYQGKEVGKMFFEGNEVGKAGCQAEIENVTTHYVEDSVPQKAKWARVICNFPNVRGWDKTGEKLGVFGPLYLLCFRASM